MGVITMTSWYSNWLRHYEGLLLNTIIVSQLKSAVSFLPYVLCLKDPSNGSQWLFRNGRRMDPGGLADAFLIGYTDKRSATVGSGP